MANERTDIGTGAVSEEADAEALARNFREFMIPVSLEQPVIVAGSGAWVEDTKGTRYLDLVAGPGVLALGHSHPAICQAVETQIRTLMQSPGKFLTPAAINYATALARQAPEGLKRTFFCNSGAEANEGALKLAKKYAFLHGRGSGIIAFEHSFHGRLTHALSVTGQIKYKAGLSGFLTVPGVVHVPYPYPLRCPSANCTDYVLSALQDAVALKAQGGYAALIIEPLAAVGGVVVPPPDFLPALRDFCTEHDIALIVDEVFTGLGRTGRMFCCEHTSLLPDILTAAKSIGGGLPLGAFIATDEMASAFAEKREHFTTFGANSVISCSAGAAALDIMFKEDLPGRAHRMGEWLLKLLQEVTDGLACVPEVRGKGLLIGIEFADPDRRLSPRPDLALQVQRLALEEGVLVSVSGAYDSVVRLSPPLTISEDEVQRAAEVLARAIRAAADDNPTGRRG